MLTEDLIVVDRTDAVGRLSARLRAGSSADSEVCDSTALAVIDLFREISTPPADGMGLLVMQYVIRNEDLKFLDSLLAGGLALAGTGYFLVPATGAVSVIGALSGLVAATLQTVRNLVKKGAKLTPEQCTMVQLLKGPRGPLREEQILRFLKVGRVVQNQIIEPDPSWTPERVNRVLGELQALRANNGSIIPVAALDGEGRWGLSDV